MHVIILNKFHIFQNFRVRYPMKSFFLVRVQRATLEADAALLTLDMVLGVSWVFLYSRLSQSQVECRLDHHPCRHYCFK